MSLFGSVALGLALSVPACGGADSDSPDGGSGGLSAEGSGGASGGSNGEGTGGEDSSGGAAIGGAGGASESACGRFDPSNSDCGVCEQSLEEYCSEPDACQLQATPTCRVGLVSQQVEVGCGFIKVSWQGDVGDAGVSIWALSDSMGGAHSLDSGELVYAWSNGRLSSGCRPETTVGIEPECDDWSTQCTGEGLGGSGPQID